VQNNLARVVCQRSRITDARPLLQSLLGCLQGAHVQDGALDVEDTAHIVSTIPGRSATSSTTKLTRSLRSSDAPLLTVPRTQTALATRAFSVAAPTVWERFTVQRPVVRLAVDFQTSFENSLFYRRVCVTYSFTSASVSSVVTALYKSYYYYYYYYL